MSNDIQYTLRVAAESGPAAQQFAVDLNAAFDKINAGLDKTVAALEKQVAALGKMATAGTQAAQQNTQQAQTLSNLADAYDKVIAKIDPAAKITQQYVERLKTMDDALNKGIISQQTYADGLSKLNDWHKQATENAGKHNAMTQLLGMSFGQTSREIRALLDESTAGRWKNFDSTLVNIVAHIAQANTGFLGVAAPLAGLTAIFVALAAAAVQGAAEETKWSNSLVLSGNYAGTTAGQMNQMAQAIAATGAPIGTAKEALTEMATSGKFTADQMQNIGAVAASLEELVNIPVKTTVKQFEELGKSPVEATLKLDQSIHYASASLIDQIATLERHGEHLEAGRVAIEAYSDALNQRIPAMEQNLGYIEKAWLGIKNAASDAWAAMMNLGKSTSIQSQLDEVNTKIKAAQEQGGLGANELNALGGGSESSLFNNTDMDKLLSQRADLQHKLQAQEATAAQQASQARVNSEGAEAAEYLANLDKRAKGVDKLTDKYKQLDAELEKIRASNRAQGLDENAGIDPARIDQIKEYLKRQSEYRTPKGRAKSTVGIENSETREALSGPEGDVKQANDDFRNQTQELTQLYSTRQKSADDYYNDMIDLIDQHYQKVQMDYDQEIQILQQAQTHASTQKQRIDLQKQINDLVTKSAQLEQDASHDEDKAANVRSAALQKQAAAVKDYAEALDRAQGSAADKVNTSVAALSQGSYTTQQMQAYDALQKDYDTKKQQLDKQHDKGEISDDSYSSDLDKLRSYYDNVYAITKDGYDRMDAVRGDWEAGVKRGFENFQYQASDAASQSEQAFKDFSSGITNALVTFATTGKLSFGSFALTVIQDIIKMEVQATESKIFSLIGNLVSGALSGGATGSEAAGASATSTPDDLITGYGHHSGGIAGGAATFTGQYSAGLWSGASRYHTGGIVDGEVPIIAQKGEAVMPTVRMSDGTLGVKMSGGQTNGQNVSIHTPITLNVNYTGSGGNGSGDGNNMNDFADKMGDHLQSVMDQRIAKWAQDQTRPGGALAGAQKGRMGS